MLHSKPDFLWLSVFSDNRGRIVCSTPAVSADDKYALRLTFTEKDYVREMTNPKFTYRPNTVVESLQPDSVVAW